MIVHPPFDTAAAADFLARRYGNRASGAVEIGRGEWATAYGFVLDGEACVARFGAQSDDFAKDRIAAAYASPGLPVPRILEIGEAPGGFYAVSERAYGSDLDALDDAGMRAVLPSLFAAHDAMRLADVSRTTGYGGWDASGNAPHATWQQALRALPGDGPSSRMHGWRDRMTAYPAARAAFDEGYDCLRGLVAACPSSRHLVHSDPLNHNILVAGGQITAVLDWGCGMYGDFLYDLAHLTFSPCWFPAWRSIDFAAEAERHYDAIGVAVPAMRERLRCYEIHIGLDALAYNAFCERPAELDLIARRTLEAVRRDDRGA
jgi:hygromycin-B 4-O-kinase